MGTTLAVRARGITKCFGEVVALDGVDLDVVQGQIHGLVGPNGAGKTTLLGLLLGLSVADAGELEILGAKVGRALAAPDRIAGVQPLSDIVPNLAPGPVPATGPVSKLTTANREHDYRQRTSDPKAAHQVALDTPGLHVVKSEEVLVVRALVPAVDELVVRLV